MPGPTQAYGNVEFQMGGTLAAVGTSAQALGRSGFTLSGRLGVSGSSNAQAYGYTEHTVGGTLAAAVKPIPPRGTTGAGLAPSYTGWGG